MPDLRANTTPLPQKLGIKPAIHLVILAAPDGFTELIGDPLHTTRITASTNLALCFIRSRNDLSAVLDMLTAQLPLKASAWIIHPKRTGRYASGFHQDDVRNAALPLNLVDYKICSVDDDWSGIKFAWRKTPKA